MITGPEWINNPAGPIYDVTPEHIGRYAIAFNDALLRFEEAGIRVPAHGRLRSELASLQDVAAAGEFPRSREKQRLIAHAVSDAYDLCAIAQIVPSERTSQEDGELRKLVKGAITPALSTESSLRLQTQWWAKAILTFGGSAPTIPVAAGKSPDLLIQDGSIVYGIEVKRPQSTGSIASLLAEGARQLRKFGVEGALLLDVSRALPISSLNWIQEGDAPQAMDEFLDQVAHLATSLQPLVFDETIGTPRAKFSCLMCLFVLARHWTWIEAPSPRLITFATALVQSCIPKQRNLRHHRTVSLARRITKGLNAVGYDFPLQNNWLFPQLYPKQ